MHEREECSELSVDFLSGGGEMGRRIRTHDWNATTLGPPDRWPLSLQTVVKRMLVAGSPIAVGWGPELLTLHNDAYTNSIIARNPNGVGLPLCQLSPEVWKSVGPLVENAMLRGESAQLEDHLFCIYRNGHAEEAYLSFYCSPLPDDAADICGVMVRVNETTDQVIKTRRSAALREISAAGLAVRSVENACHQVLDAVSRRSADIPFALLYSIHNANEGQMRLVATAALAPGTPASPHILAFESATKAASWPVGIALNTNSTVLVDNLMDRFDPLPAGDWPLAPRCAVIVPLVTSGRKQPDGALICGVSPRRELGTCYFDFIDLVAKHVAAVITAGRLREKEERDVVSRSAAKVARTERGACIRVVKARFAGALEERTRLAREIHDTLLQGVTAIALQLRGTLPQLGMASDDALAALERIVDLAENTSREVRQVVWDIRPNPQNEREFVRSIESAAHLTLAGSQLAFHLKACGRTRRVHTEAQEVVLRIVQEAIANVVRHASATTIRLTLSFREHQLRVAVSDDGCGFTVDPGTRSHSWHFGLLGMHERAEQIGGSLRVRSAPRRGTTVMLDVPLPTAVTKGSFGRPSRFRVAVGG